MSNAQSIIGDSRTRASADYYPTHPSATHALFAREKFDGTVWECASGEGHMSKVIEQYNDCISSDIRDDENIYGDKGVNFLVPSRLTANNIITNPPFKYAKEFVEQTKLVADKKIALLLKLAFLEGAGRYQMFQDTGFPLKTVYVFSKRLPWAKEGLADKAGGMLAFAWFVWDKDYKGKATLEWIL